MEEDRTGLYHQGSTAIFSQPLVLYGSEFLL